VRAAEARGVPAPLNAALAQLVRARQAVLPQFRYPEGSGGGGGA
jgi:hypothetical protein